MCSGVLRNSGHDSFRPRDAVQWCSGEPRSENVGFGFEYGLFFLESACLSRACMSFLLQSIEMQLRMKGTSECAAGGWRDVPVFPSAQTMEELLDKNARRKGMSTNESTNPMAAGNKDLNKSTKP